MELRNAPESLQWADGWTGPFTVIAQNALQGYNRFWKDGAWSGPLDVAQNTTGRATPWYVGAAADKASIFYVYNQDGLYLRTETNGVLSTPQSVADYLAARGHAGSPLAFFVDHVFANDRIVFFQLDLSRCVLLVLHRRVEVTGPFRRLELDLLALALLRH